MIKHVQQNLDNILPETFNGELSPVVNMVTPTRETFWCIPGRLCWGASRKSWGNNPAPSAASRIQETKGPTPGICYLLQQVSCHCVGQSICKHTVGPIVKGKASEVPNPLVAFLKIFPSAVARSLSSALVGNCDGHPRRQ